MRFFTPAGRVKEEIYETPLIEEIYEIPLSFGRRFKNMRSSGVHM